MNRSFVGEDEDVADGRIEKCVKCEVGPVVVREHHICETRGLVKATRTLNGGYRLPRKWEPIVRIERSGCHSRTHPQQTRCQRSNNASDYNCQEQADSHGVSVCPRVGGLSSHEKAMSVLGIRVRVTGLQGEDPEV